MEPSRKHRKTTRVEPRVRRWKETEQKTQEALEASLNILDSSLMAKATLGRVQIMEVPS